MATSSRRLSMLAMYLTVGLVCTRLIASGPQESLAPSQLWEAMILAKGGRDRLHAVETLVINLDGREQQHVDSGRTLGDLHDTIVYQLPDRYWSWFDTRPRIGAGFGASVWNAGSQSFWVSNAGGRAHPRQWNSSNLVEVVQTDQIVYFLETRHVRPKPASITVDLNRQRAVLQASAPGFKRVEFVVDLRTNLVLECTVSRWTTLATSAAPVEGPALTWIFEEYGVVDGIHLPIRQRGDRSRLSYVINPKLDPKLFDTPPDGVTRRDDWRKFLR